MRFALYFQVAIYKGLYLLENLFYNQKTLGFAKHFAPLAAASLWNWKQVSGIFAKSISFYLYSFLQRFLSAKERPLEILNFVYLVLQRYSSPRK